MARVLLTGANGFIGSHVARALVAEGHEVHALVRQAGDGLWRLSDVVSKIKLIAGDLLDPGAVAAAVEKARPELCLHLAWYAVPGKYLHAAENLALVGATLGLAQRLRDAGCARFVGVGTCFEYDVHETGQHALSETSVTKPQSLYATSKLALYRILEKFAQTDIGDGKKMSFAWARPFYQYGPFEPEGRLTTHIMGALSRGGTADVTQGEQIRDFLHVADVAAAVCAIATSKLEGAVNVGSGVPVTVRELVTTLGRLCSAADKIRFGAIPYREGDPMFVCANTAKLKTTGFVPRFDLESGLADMVEAHRSKEQR